MLGSREHDHLFQGAPDPSAGNLSEFDLPIVLILKFEALGQLGRADDAEIALDRALAISPTNFDFHVRTRPPWFSPEKHAHLAEAYARQD